MRQAAGRSVAHPGLAPPVCTYLVQADGLARLDALPRGRRPRAAQQVQQLVVPVLL